MCAAWRMCVFQGPIFDDDIDRMADDVQIPSAFFKVVVWGGQDALKAVGLVVDQGPLLDESRVSLGPPRSPATVNVNHWRVSIRAIEKRTGLDFGADARAAAVAALGCTLGIVPRRCWPPSPGWR